MSYNLKKRSQQRRRRRTGHIGSHADSVSRGLRTGLAPGNAEVTGDLVRAAVRTRQSESLVTAGAREDVRLLSHPLISYSGCLPRSRASFLLTPPLPRGDPCGLTTDRKNRAHSLRLPSPQHLLHFTSPPHPPCYRLPLLSGQRLHLRSRPRSISLPQRPHSANNPPFLVSPPPLPPPWHIPSLNVLLKSVPTQKNFPWSIFFLSIKALGFLFFCQFS